MGAKTWMLVSSDESPRKLLKKDAELNTEKTLALAHTLFPHQALDIVETVTLEFTAPNDDVIYAGSFNGIDIIAATEFGIDYPSSLSRHFLENIQRKHIYLHAMHSVVDWCAFAYWENRELKRSLSLSPDSDVLEDIGSKFPFEAPFWQGQHPVFEPGDEDEEDYPFNFHPLELAEAALEGLFGFVIEGYPGSPHHDALLNPSDIPLLALKRREKHEPQMVNREFSKPWWKFW